VTEIKFFCGLALKKIQYNMKNAASGRVGCYLQDDMEAKKNHDSNLHKTRWD
jgi:hypothetical protein